MTQNKHECDLMCERLAAYLESDLMPAELAEANEHLAGCAGCSAALAELRAIAASASQLPLLTPSRDLWSGIESRIGTKVTSLPQPRLQRSRSVTWRVALAAAALIALSAGSTYMVMNRAGTSTAASTVATTTAAPLPKHDSVVPQPAPVVTQPVPAPNASLASLRTKKDVSAARTYDREIGLLDSLVRTQQSTLDPKTVAVIRQNLKIIDQAIAESRAALARDPHSSLLTNRLDNVLGSKVELLRTMALLPSQS